jgi:hypothetical protein
MSLESYERVDASGNKSLAVTESSTPPAALADGASNPSASNVGANILGFNGTTWDRIKAGITAVTSTLTGFLNTLPWAVFHTTPTVRTNNQGGPLEADANGNLLVSQATKQAGEDITNDVTKVEERYLPLLVTGDTLVKSGAGFIHAITFAPNDSAPTAGNLDVYDNTTNSGTKVFSMAFTTTYFVPFTVILDCSMTNGIYADFTTTADVNVTFSYR